MFAEKWRKLHLNISIYLAGFGCVVLSRLRTLGGETHPPPNPTPVQPERILNNRSVLSTSIVNDTVLHQALGNERDHCLTALSAIRGDRAMLSTNELCHSRGVSNYWQLEGTK